MRWNRHGMQELQQYKIFIASPSGLEVEREKLRDEVRFYSTYDAEPEGLSFKVVGWEDIPPSFGNPQGVINPYLCGCDFYILLLHNRWGTPPGGGSRYSSGSEEEFNLAYTCLMDQKYPMQEIALFCKPMDQNERRRKQGRRVIAFINKIKGNRNLYFREFSSIEEFHSCIRQCLAKWRLKLAGRMESVPTPTSVRDFFDDAELRETGEKIC